MRKGASGAAAADHNRVSPPRADYKLFPSASFSSIPLQDCVFIFLSHLDCLLVLSPGALPIRGIVRLSFLLLKSRLLTRTRQAPAALSGF